MALRVKKEQVFFGIFLLVPIVMLWDVISKGLLLFGHDTVMLEVPFRSFTNEMFYKYGSMPLWMPSQYFGVPLVDSTNLIFFYPTNLLFMFLHIPVVQTLSIDLIIHMFLAAFGTYIFLRKIEVREEAAFFGALAFMMSGVVVSFANAGHFGNIKAAALIPFIFYFFRRALDEKKFSFYLSAGAVMALQVLCIGMQVLAYSALALGLYAIFELFLRGRDKKEAIKAGLGLLAAFAFVIIISAPQFFASLNYIKHSWRGAITYEQFASWALNPKEAISLILPSFFGLKDSTYYGYWDFNIATYYMGVVPFFLAAFAFILKKHRREALFFCAVSGLYLLFALGGATPLYKIFYYLPIFKNFRNPCRFLYIFTFFISVVSAIGLNNLLAVSQREKIPAFKEDLPMKITATAAGVLGIAVIIMFANFAGAEALVQSLYYGVKKAVISAQQSYIVTGAAEMIRSDFIFFFISAAAFLFASYMALRGKIKRAAVIVAILAAAHLLDTGRLEKQFISGIDYNSQFNPADTIANILKEDKSIFRTIDPGFAWKPVNKNIVYGLEFLSGYHGVAPAKYFALQQKQAFGDIKVNRLFNVKYYLVPGEVAKSAMPAGMVEHARVNFGNMLLTILRDDYTMPRAVVYTAAKNVGSEAAALEAVVKGEYNPGECVTDAVTGLPEGRGSFGQATITQYLPQKIIIQASSPVAGMVYVSNMNYPGWKVKVDNKNEKIYNVNYAGQGVLITPGTHTVEFYYEAGGVKAGILASLAGLALLAAVFLLEFRRRKEQKA